MHFEASILQSNVYYALCKYLEEVRGFFLSCRDEGCTVGDNSVMWVDVPSFLVETIYYESLKSCHKITHE